MQSGVLAQLFTDVNDLGSIFIDFSVRSMRWIFIHVLDVKSYGCMDNV